MPVFETESEEIDFNPVELADLPSNATLAQVSEKLTELIDALRSLGLVQLPPPPTSYGALVQSFNPWYFHAGDLVTGLQLPSQVNNPTAYTFVCRFTATPGSSGGFFGFDDKPTLSAPGPSDRALYLVNGKIELYNYNGGAYYLTTPSDSRDGIKHTLIARMGAGLDTAIFIDGVKIVSTPTTGAFNFLGYWKIGYTSFSGSLSSVTMHQPAIFLSALSDEQILSISQSS